MTKIRHFVRSVSWVLFHEFSASQHPHETFWLSVFLIGSEAGKGFSSCLRQSWPVESNKYFNFRLGIQPTAKWIWDRSIYSIIKPSFDMALFQYFWRFTQICKKFAAFARKIVFVIVSEQFYYRNNNKNNFVSKCCKFLANLCKSSEILEQCHVKWWLKYRNNRSSLMEIKL